MWIVPKNIKSSQFAPVRLESKEDFIEQAQMFEQSLMWRSKPSLILTWWRRWRRDWWIKHLFGRICKPSMASHFINEYTESLGVIHVKEKALPDKENSQKTPDSFTRTLKELLNPPSLFGASSKTYKDIYQVPLSMFSKAYKVWATKLRQDCTRRVKSALHINGSESLSLHVPTLQSSGNVWPTPTTNMGARQKSPNGVIRTQVPMAVQLWATPTARDYRGGMSKETVEKRMEHSRGVNLVEMLDRQRLFPTPQASEVLKAAKTSKQTSLTQMALIGQLDQGKHNTNGKSREQLNPGWVAQLMGTTLEQTFFACLATE